MGEQASEFPVILSWDLHEQQAGERGWEGDPTEESAGEKSRGGHGCGHESGRGHCKDWTEAPWAAH